MTWAEPPQPLDGFAGAVMMIAALLVAVWVMSPIFNWIMRVLQ